MRTMPLLVAFVLSVCVLGAGRADAQLQTGFFDATYKERSPLTEGDALTKKIGLRADTGYKLEEESFTVYVPKDYKADGSYGLIVYLDSGDEGLPFQGWSNVYDRHKLIYISPKNAAGGNNMGKALGMALDGAANIMKAYKIDKDRVYISGIAGTLSASVLALHYPEVFTGGGFYLLGSRFYKRAKGVQPEFAEPDARTLELVKTKRVFLFMTGQMSKDLGDRDRAVYQAYQDEGFKAVDMVEMAGQGNIIPTEDLYATAVARLEEMHAALKAGKTVTATNIAAAPGAGPAMQGGAADSSDGIKRGVFKTSFEKRSKESESRALSRVFDIANRDREDYNLPDESFHVYVPEDYDPGVPHGLLVALSSEIGDDGKPPEPYLAAMRQLRIIWVGAAGAAPDATDQRRLGLPLDAVENMKSLYNIDTDRIYVTGVGRGGISASKLGLNYPQIFTGGIYFQGAAYYRDLIEGNTRYLAAIPPPGGGEMRLAKQKSRLIFVVGAAGRIKDFVSVVFEKGYKAEKFEHAHYIAIENMGDTFPGAAAFEKGVKAADAVLASTDRAMWAIGLRYERTRKYADAYAAFAKAMLRTENEKLKQEAEEKLESLRSSREKQLAGAKEALDGGNAALAKASLERIAREWGDLAGKEVADMLASIGDAPRTTVTRPKPTPPVTPRPQPEKNPRLLEQEAAVLLAQAKKAIDGAEFDDARVKLKKIVEEYEKTPSFNQAKTLLAAIGEE